jgi:hypothetical protein
MPSAYRGDVARSGSPPQLLVTLYADGNAVGIESARIFLFPAGFFQNYFHSNIS